MAAAWSGRQEKAAGPPIEPGPAEHLALEPLQAVDVPFDRPLTPGQRHPGLDSGHICPEPFGKTPEGREGTGGGTFQPGFELSRLMLPDEAGEVLRQGHRLCQFRGQLSQRRQLTVIVIRGAR